MTATTTFVQTVAVSPTAPIPVPAPAASAKGAPINDATGLRLWVESSAGQTFSDVGGMILTFYMRRAGSAEWTIATDMTTTVDGADVDGLSGFCLQKALMTRGGAEVFPVLRESVVSGTATVPADSGKVRLTVEVETLPR